MKRNLGIVGIYVLGYLLISVAIVVYIVINGLDVNDLEALNQVATNFTAVFYIVTTIIFIVVFRKYFKEQGQRFFASFKKNFLYIIGGIFLIYGVMMAVSTILVLLGVETEADNQQAIIDMITYSSSFQLILIALFVVIGAPIVEELVFRKGLYGIIGILTTKLLLKGDESSNTRKTLLIANIAGIAISSLAFGMMHALDIYLLVYASLGVVLGTMYYLSNKNIYVSIFVHMIYNSISLAVTIFLI